MFDYNLMMQVSDSEDETGVGDTKQLGGSIWLRNCFLPADWGFFGKEFQEALGVQCGMPGSGLHLGLTERGMSWNLYLTTGTISSLDEAVEQGVVIGVKMCESDLEDLSAMLAVALAEHRRQQGRQHAKLPE